MITASEVLQTKDATTFTVLAMNKIKFLVLIGVLVCLNFGCSDSKISTGYVEGVITFQGAPLPGATISFAPKDAGGQHALGFSDENGVYKLTTEGGRDEGGALPGEYLVTISKVNVKVSPVLSEEKNTQPVSKSESAIPVKYNNKASSGLTATVNKGKNNIPFNLAE